jgi:uncharacterized protein YaiL (DUF2058 family)
VARSSWRTRPSEPAAKQAEKDRQLEAERHRQQREREIVAQIRQLIETHRLDRARGEVAYQFVQDKKIKKLHVTEPQRDQLARGQIAIVALGEGHELVPTTVAEKIRQRDEAAVVLLNDRNVQDEDDPYADYPIPDDLMW